jgi:hypothetical protein
MRIACRVCRTNHPATHTRCSGKKRDTARENLTAYDSRDEHELRISPILRDLKSLSSVEDVGTKDFVGKFGAF